MTETTGVKKFLYLPEGYKKRTNRVVTGIAKTGEVSSKGTVAHTSHWDDRVDAEVAPAGIHYGLSKSTGEIRPLTYAEQVEKGYIVPGRGPVGARA